MADIAQLGLSVDSSQAKLAAKELDNLAAAGAKAEGAVDKMSKGAKRSLAEIAASTQAAQQAMQRMLESQERQERIMQQTSRQFDDLNNALRGNATASNAAAQAAQNAAQAMGAQSGASKAAEAAARGQAAASTSAAAASGQMGGQASAAGAAVGGMASKLMTAVAAALSLNKAIQDMDAWTNMNNRIRLVTEGQAQFMQAQSNIINIANSTRQPLAETAELYQRMATNQKALGLSGNELAGVVKTINQSMVISGASAAGGAAALMQLGQAFNSGVLRGEEFNSVMEQAPGLMQAIAAGMGKTVGEMRGLAEAGKITSEEIIKALQKQADAVDTAFGKMGSTIGGAGTVFANKLTEFIGRMDESSGASKALAAVITALGNNIGALATAVGTVVAAGLAAWLGTSAVAAGGFAVALGGVGTAMTGLLASMGPAGWLILGLGAAATAWQLLGSKSSAAGQQMDSASEKATAAANKLVAGIVPALNTAIGAYDKLIAKQKETLGTAKTPVDEIAKGLKEADLNLQKLAQQVARAQRGVGEFVNLGPKERAAAEKALTTELENASKRRGELAKKEAEYNGNVVALYVKGKERQTDASEKLLKIEEAKAAREKALAAAGADRAQQEKVNSAYRIELAKIEEEASKKSAKSSVEAGENEVASIRARVKAVQANIAALQEYGAAAEKQTDGDRLVLKIQEELAGGIKGVARANKEKALAAAESLASAQKEEQAIKSQIELQKKQEEEYRKTIQAMSDVAEKTEQQAIGIEAQNEAYGRSKTAIEQQVLASKKLQLQRLEELGLTGDYTKALGLQIAAQERLVDALAASDYKKMSEHTDKLLSNANAQAELYADELELTGLTAVERAKVVAQRQVELKYAKEIDEVNRSNLSTDEKQVQLRKIAEAQQIESSAAVNKVIQDDFARTSEQINNSLTDALLNAFEGGKNAAQGVKDAIVKMFNDMVLRPVISAILAPVSGALGGVAQSLTGGAGGSGGIVVSIGSSIAGSSLGAFFGNITTAVSAGFKGATLGAGLMGPTTAGAGGAMGFGNTLAAIPGWGWALAGIAALASLGIGKTPGEQHMGGLYSTSGKTDMAAAMRVTGGGGWDDGAWARDLTERADAAIGSSLEKVGTGLIDIFEQVNALAGGVADEFELTLGFAANLNGEGKDKNAFGYFDLISKATGEVLKSYQNRELGTDTGAAMTKLTNDAARAMLDALAKADVPQWAKNALKELEAVPGLQAMQEFLAYPQKLAESFGIAQQSMSEAIAEGFVSGDGEAAGQALARTVLGGIQNSIIGAASNQISMLVTNMILTPILSALANAQDPAAALAEIDFDAVIAKAEGIGEGLATALNNPALQTAMEKIDGVLNSVGKSAVDAAGNLQLIADKAADVATAPAPTPATVEVLQGNPYSMDTARNAYDLQPEKQVSALVAQTLESNKKVSELLQDLLKPKKEYANRYLELSDNLAAKREENNLPDWYAKLPAWEGELAAMLKELDALMSNPDAQDWQISSLTMQARDLMEFINQGKKDASRMEIELREWYLAQSRLIASEDAVQLADETRSAKEQTAELLRTGGMTDQVTQLQESFAKKFEGINNGINKALQDEIERLGANSAEGQELLKKMQENSSWWAIPNFFSEEELSKGKDIFGENFGKLLPSSGMDFGDPLQGYKDVLEKLQSEMDDLTQEQQDYLHSLNDWYKAQSELLSTQMLVDINQQIKGLEAEEKGPLAAIKDAIQKYVDDFTELGTLTEEVQAQLDKLAGLQLDQARTSLYDQLLSQEERRAKEQDKLNAAFTELGAATPASTDALRAMIDAARDAGNVGLADSLLELIPAFIALQGAADGVGGGPLGAANDAYAAVEKAIAAERGAVQRAFDSRMNAINKEREAAQEAHSDQMKMFQDELKAAQERAALEKTALGLLGRSAELRAQELDSMDAGNRALQQRVWALQDASAAVDKSLATLQRSIAAEKERITEQAQAQIDAITDGAEARQKSVEEAQKSAQDLTAVFDEITNAVKTLRGNAQEEVMRMEQARAYISMALSVVRAGGSVDREKLGGAIATVTSDTAQGYITSADYRFAQARQAAELQALADITGEQKDVAQATLDAAIAANDAAQKQITAITEARDAQLRALDKQLKEAQDAVSVMRGVDLSVIAVGDAVTALDASMLVYEAERAALESQNLEIGRSSVALLELQIANQQEQFDAQMAALDLQAQKAQERFDAQMAALDAQLAAAKEQIDALNGIDNSVMSVEDALEALQKAIEAASDAPEISGDNGYGVFGHEISTPYTPTQTAPRSFAPSAFGSAPDSGELASLVVALTGEVQRLQSIVREGNGEQRRTADAVNGRGEAPMLVESV